MAQYQSHKHSGIAMKNFLKILCLSGISLLSAPNAFADIYDENIDAEWDAISFMASLTGIKQTAQTFENGFVDQQFLNTWIPVGGNNAFRIGFGDDIANIQWGGFISATGGPATAFGPDDSARGTNIQGNYFLSDGNPDAGASTAFIQFYKPIDYLIFNTYDYASGSNTAVESKITTFIGADFEHATEVQSSGLSSVTIAADEPNGNVGFYVKGSLGPVRTPFNLFTFKMDQVDNGIGFDNFMVKTAAPVPEPESYAILGLGLVSVFLARRRSKR